MNTALIIIAYIVAGFFTMLFIDRRSLKASGDALWNYHLNRSNHLKYFFLFWWAMLIVMLLTFLFDRIEIILHFIAKKMND